MPLSKLTKSVIRNFQSVSRQNVSTSHSSNLWMNMWKVAWLAIFFCCLLTWFECITRWMWFLIESSCQLLFLPHLEDKVIKSTMCGYGCSVIPEKGPRMDIIRIMNTSFPWSLTTRIMITTIMNHDTHIRKLTHELFCLICRKPFYVKWLNVLCMVFIVHTKKKFCS
jgi:hypothetical protein